MQYLAPLKFEAPEMFHCCNEFRRNAWGDHEMLVCPTTTLRYAPSVVRACANRPFCDGTKVNGSRIAGDGWRHFKNPLKRLGGRFGPCQSLFSFCDVSPRINMLTHHLLMTRVIAVIPDRKHMGKNCLSDSLALAPGWPGENPPDEKRWVLVSVSLVKLMITPQWCKDFKTNRMIGDDSINTNRDWTQQMWFLNNKNDYFPIDVSTCFNISMIVRIFCVSSVFQNRSTYPLVI